MPKAWVVLLLMLVVGSIRLPGTTEVSMAWAGESLFLPIPQQDSVDQPEDVQGLTGDQLVEQQRVLSRQFQQLDQKLFDLYQLERDSRPARADLLRQMYEWSQSRNMSGRFDQIVDLVQRGELRLAQQAQQQTLEDLKTLMEILQKEDQNQKRDEEKRRLKENLQAVKRLLQMQSSLEQETRSVADPSQLEWQQQRVGDDTEQLAEKVRRQQQGDEDPNRLSPEPENAETTPDQGPDEGRNSEDSGNEENSDDATKPDRDPSADPSDKDSASQASPTQPPGTPSSDNPGNASSPDASPLEERLKQAREQMQQAQQALQEAERQQATEKMQEAMEQLEAAKEELEKILRQSREEEMMTTLARLEDQFRQMLEQQLKINQSTLQLDQIPTQVRGADHEIGAARLAGDQRKNAVAAARAVMILRDDATSIALAVTVEQLNDDMQSVADLLVSGSVGTTTQQLEADIVESLEMLVDSVVQAQQDVQKQQAESSPANSDSAAEGEMPLVDQIAELKMLKGLQERILRRHRQISQQFQLQDATFGEIEDQQARERLQKLESQQLRLFEITREMVKQIR